MYPSWSKTGPPRLLCGFHWAYYPRIKHEVPRMWIPTCGRVKEKAEALWNWSRVHRCSLSIQFAVLWESLLYFFLNPSLAMERERMSPLGQRRGASEGHSDSGLRVGHTPSPGLTRCPGVGREKMSAPPREWIRLQSESDCSPWIRCGSHRESQLGHEDSLEWHKDTSEAHASEARRQRGVSGWLEQRHGLFKGTGAWGTAGFSEEVFQVSHTNKSQPQISPKAKGHWHQFTQYFLSLNPTPGPSHRAGQNRNWWWEDSWPGRSLVVRSGKQTWMEWWGDNSFNFKWVRSFVTVSGQIELCVNQTRLDNVWRWPENFSHLSILRNQRHP